MTEVAASSNRPIVRRRTLLSAAATMASSVILGACGASADASPTGVPTAPRAVTPIPATAVAPSPSMATPISANPAPVATMTATTTVASVAVTAVVPTPLANVPVVGVAPSPPVADADGRITNFAPGVPDGYWKLPPPYKANPTIPGKGGKVSIFLIAYSAPPPPREQNRYWQELERRLGVAVEQTLAPASTYTEKLAALTAGGDLPDLTFVDTDAAPDQFKAITQGAYTDLTPYLTGDALKNFPNLAAFPPQLWKNAAIRGKIYGVPRPRYLTGAGLVYRQDWAEKVGIPNPKNADEFFALMTAFVKGDPNGTGKADTFALGAEDGYLANIPIQNMFRVPNGWRRNADGTLTSAIETDEFKAAVAFARRLWDAGLYHPDAPTWSNAQDTGAFSAGKIGAYQDGWYAAVAARILLRKNLPKATLNVLIPPGFDGGKATTWNTSGYFGFVAIPAKVGHDGERVRELLRILDYYAAPFGSEEYIFMNFGIEGVDHEVGADGSRVLNDRGKAEIGDTPKLASAPRIFYFPDRADVELQLRAGRDLLAIGVDDPTLGLFSPTSVAKAGELKKLGTDRVLAVVTGRAPLSALDEYVKDWRSRGGDQIRREYQDALKQ